MFVTADCNMTGPLAGEFHKDNKNRQLIFDQRRGVGGTAVLGPAATYKPGVYAFYALVKASQRSPKVKTRDLAASLIGLKYLVEKLELKELSVCTCDPGLDGVPWGTVYALLDVLFSHSECEIKAYTFFTTYWLFYMEQAPGTRKQSDQDGTSDVAIGNSALPGT